MYYQPTQAYNFDTDTKFRRGGSHKERKLRDNLADVGYDDIRSIQSCRIPSHLNSQFRFCISEMQADVCVRIRDIP